MYYFIQLPYTLDYFGLSYTTILNEKILLAKTDSSTYIKSEKWPSNSDFGRSKLARVVLQAVSKYPGVARLVFIFTCQKLEVPVGQTFQKVHSELPIEIDSFAMNKS